MSELRIKAVLFWSQVDFTQVEGVNGAECKANSVTNSPISLTPNQTAWLQTPTLSSGTFANMTCSWKVSGPSGYIIFIGLDYQTPSQHTTWTVYNDSCMSEYLRVYDGASKSALVLGTACGDVPATGGIFSSGSNVLVEVMTGPHASRTRVHVFITAIVPMACQDLAQNYSASSLDISTFTSPYYPHGIGYSVNSSCTWQITAPPGYVIKISLQVSADCYNGDHIEIYDGKEITRENMMDKFCLKPNSVIYSTSLSVLVRFISGPTLSSWQIFKGFQASFSAVLVGSSCKEISGQGVASLGLLGPNPGSLSSPGYPNAFPNGLNCYWRIRAPPGHVIKLTFQAINIEGKNCNRLPSLKLRDGPLYDSAILWSAVCAPAQTGHYPTFSVVSSGRYMGVEFQTSSDYPALGFGFKTEYSFVPLETKGSCTGTGLVHLHGQEASFHSPNYFPYARFLMTGQTNTPCMWNITVETGYRIKVSILYRRSDISCANENITFYDSKSSVTLFTNCGFSYSNVPFYTSGSNLLVVYNTQAPQTRGNGFVGSFQAVRVSPKPYACSMRNPGWSIFLKTVGKESLASFGYPGDYPYFAKCKWRITPPFAKVVRLIITSFWLKESRNCTQDFVAVSGKQYGVDKVQLARLCGHVKLPFVITSPGDMEIVFSSDAFGETGFPGFEGYVEATEDPAFNNCTVRKQDNRIALSGLSGSFSSPRFPHGSPSSMMCTWLITVPKGSKIKLRVKPLNLWPGCDTYLEIKDAASGALLGKYCNREELPSMFSSGDKLWVRFESQSYGSGSAAFHATFEAVNMLPLSISCRESSIISVNAPASIASYDYPLKYENDVTCQWNIRVSDGKRVRLEFDHFDLEESPDCSNDYIEVRDSYNSPPIGKFCGHKKPWTLRSDDTGMMVKFVTNTNGRYGGFKATIGSELSKRTIIPIAVLSSLAFLGLLVLACAFRRRIVAFCKRCGTSENGRNQGVNPTSERGTDIPLRVAR